MKVYELIKELEKYPAGAEINISQCISIKDLVNEEIIDTDCGGVTYAMSSKIDGIHGDNTEVRIHITK